MVKLLFIIIIALITIPLVIFNIKSFSKSKKDFNKEFAEEKVIVKIDRNQTKSNKSKTIKLDKFDKEWNDFDKDWKNF